MSKIIEKLLVSGLIFISLCFCSEKTKIISPYPESFAGIGIELEKDGPYARIVKVLPNSPADEAGIKQDDIIIAINNEDISGLNLADTVDKIRGKPDSSVILTIESVKDKTINVLSVKRKRSILTEKGYVFEK
jgi:C-terminal processing protease CtpA/Prc